MKKVFQNKFVIALSIVVIAGSIVYFTTWGNKKWLIDQISDKGGAPQATPDANGTVPVPLEMRTISSLQKTLKSLS